MEQKQAKQDKLYKIINALEVHELAEAWTALEDPLELITRS